MYIHQRYLSSSCMIELFPFPWKLYRLYITRFNLESFSPMQNAEIKLFIGMLLIIISSVFVYQPFWECWGISEIRKHLIRRDKYPNSHIIISFPKKYSSSYRIEGWKSWPRSGSGSGGLNDDWAQLILTQQLLWIIHTLFVPVL